jgi:hypothetical protein
MMGQPSLSVEFTPNNKQPTIDCGSNPSTTSPAVQVQRATFSMGVKTAWITVLAVEVDAGEVSATLGFGGSDAAFDLLCQRNETASVELTYGTSTHNFSATFHL